MARRAGVSRPRSTALAVQSTSVARVDLQRSALSSLPDTGDFAADVRSMLRRSSPSTRRPEVRAALPGLLSISFRSGVALECARRPRATGPPPSGRIATRRWNGRSSPDIDADALFAPFTGLTSESSCGLVDSSSRMRSPISRARHRTLERKIQMVTFSYAVAPSSTATGAPLGWPTFGPRWADRRGCVRSAADGELVIDATGAFVIPASSRRIRISWRDGGTLISIRWPAMAPRRRCSATAEIRSLRSREPARRRGRSPVFLEDLTVEGISP